MRTIIGVCLDESGSMDEGGKRDAAISAYNEYLHDQQKNAVDECLMAVASFNTVARVSQKMRPIADVPDLSRSTYVPGGGTALFDAIAYTVREVERGMAADDRVVCVVLTDGEENSSRETTLAQVKELIAKKEGEGNWSFVYLSASPDAFAQGASMGFAHGNTAQYANTAAGVYATMDSVSHATSSLRASNATASRGMASNQHHPTTPKPRMPTPPPAPRRRETQKTDTDMWGTR